jgi:streptogramin lyase
VATPAVDGYVWVANRDSFNITRIKAADSATTTIAMESSTSLWGIAVDENYCWTTDANSNSVIRIRKADSSTSATILHCS